ncbi:MAG: O-antigen ligase family protein [Lentisphaerota bacterium]
MNKSVPNYGLYRNEKLILVGIIFTMLVMEWSYGRPEFVLPTILSYPGWLAGLVLPLLFFVRTRFILNSSARVAFNRFILLWFGFVFVLVMQMIISHDALGTYNRFILIEFVAMPLWLVVGFIYAAELDAVKRLLGRFALFAAWASLLSFCLRLTVTPDLIPLGVAGWPMRLFFLFGFCWYLSLYLTGFMSEKKLSSGVLLGFAACSLEVVFTLHKPIIWATLFSLATLFLIFSVNLKSRIFYKTFTRFLKLTVAFVLLTVVLNTIFDGVVSRNIKEFISVRVLHQSEEGDTDVTLERAAGGRFELWTNALADFGRNPWFGGGIKDSEIDLEGSVSLHNGYLDLLFIAGVFGFIIILYGIWFWLRRVVNSLKYAPLMLVQSTCLAYIVGIIMFNLGGTSRLFPGISYFIMLIFGISLRLAVDNRFKNLKILPCQTQSHVNLEKDRKLT